ncbi:MAG: oligosaccharide flippase family protein [Candidatus Omnitrophica bacterium]|nr:oligosaccharide flippase family protein [Candidatus Omnitrophota bacterium]
MSKSKEILKDATRFSISGYISSFCSFISATIVRKVLDSFFMGVYLELLLIFEYAKYSHVGIYDSLDRQIPYYNGKKETKKVEEAKNVGISFGLFTALASALIILVISYVFRNTLTPVMSIGIKVIAALVVIQSMNTFYVTLARTHHLFGVLSKYIIILALCDVLFKALLGIKFGVIGVLWATILSLTVGLLYLFKKTKVRFRITFKISAKTLKMLLAIGFPIFLGGFTFMALRNIDRIMILSLLTKNDLGYYSIAIMVHSFLFQLPNLIYVVLFPRFYEAFGDSKDDVSKIKNYVEKPTLAFAYLFPVIIGLAAITMPVFVNYVLPKYTNGITAASILLFGTFFISIGYMSRYLLIALKKQHLILIIGVLCIAISAGLNLLFVKVFNLGIRGIALGTAVTYFLYSSFTIGYAVKYHIPNLYKRITFFINLNAPIIWSIFAFYVVGRMFYGGFKDLPSDIGRAIWQMLIFLALTFPLLMHVNKKMDLYNRVKNAGFNIFKK